MEYHNKRAHSEENITTLICILIITKIQYIKQKLTELKKLEKYSIIVEDFLTYLSVRIK